MNHEVIIDENVYVKDGDETQIRVRDLPDEYRVCFQKYKYALIQKRNIRGVLKINVYKNDELISSISRNYPDLVQPLYVRQNDKEFLITSGDYMCITIVNLTDKTVESYTDESRYKFGCAICPIGSIDWDEDESSLQFEGCVWGGPYEMITFENIDLSNPVFDFSKAIRVEEE